ncbi:histidine kinase [Desulfovibrio aerotolerans]|uniref:Histidine kinase n=1 Tax=Solidesulfovibrio aerotolerans TaxID=295255 RepID=A0A7C9IS98_9BACT|nr:7TM diverse intracellular signaling domain-containing protein [Solidesulfovibrio aerotolerans]MYL83007.1 histidine kinase [Solidesulfovibrio aerotolerans]
MFHVFFFFLCGAAVFRRGRAFPCARPCRTPALGWAKPVAGANRPCLLLALVLLLPLCSPAQAETLPTMPQAQNGRVNLAGWDMAIQGPLRLDGEWEYYPGQLLSPKDFQAGVPRTGGAVYVVPNPWNRARTDQEAMGADTGFATLRLRLEPALGAGQPALALLGVNAAYHLWIDGAPAAGSGVVGTDAATEIPAPAKQIVSFANTGRPVDIVLQLSNHHTRDGGLLAPVWLGSQATLAAWRDRDNATAMFFIGAFCIMGLYHAALYWVRQTNIAPLYFSLYCFGWMGNYAASDSSGWAIRLFFPDLTARFLDPLALSCFFATIPVGYAFFRSLYPLEFSKHLQWFCNMLCVVFVLVALFASGRTLNTVLPWHYLASSLLIASCLYCLYQAWRRKRDEAGLLLAGFCVLGLIGLNDMLVDMHCLPSIPLLPVGMLVFSLSQAFALAHRFSQAFASEKRLAGALVDKNLRLETEMAERNRLEQQIVTISEEERRRISLELHDGLCQGLTAARLRCDALSPEGGRKGAGGEALVRLSSLLDTLVGQAYDLSRGLWPLEHDGVGPSFREMLRRQAESSAIPIEFHRDMPCQACPRSHLAQLYRIAQEAVANALKHARPGRIIVSLACPAGQGTVLAVRDDGCGRCRDKAPTGGLGLGIMAHRARLIGGELRILDTPGGGTEVVCTAPCPGIADGAVAADSQRPA